MDFRSEAEIDPFLNGFATGSFPRYAWTHAAHIAMATAKLYKDDNALDSIREGILHYNETQGTANTVTSGYHETLTIFWVNAVRDYLKREFPFPSVPQQHRPASRLEAVRGAIRIFGTQSGLPKRVYSFDVFQSQEARARWIPQDLVDEHAG